MTEYWYTPGNEEGIPMGEGDMEWEWLQREKIQKAQAELERKWRADTRTEWHEGATRNGPVKVRRLKYPRNRS
jgi:hypothetical protein